MDRTRSSLSIDEARSSSLGENLSDRLRVLARPLFHRVYSADSFLEYKEKHKSRSSYSQPTSPAIPRPSYDSTGIFTPTTATHNIKNAEYINKPPVFRNAAHELGFNICLCIAMAITEYLVSGMSALLPGVRASTHDPNPLDLWPGIILALTQAALTLPFGQLTDKIGGYKILMSGVVWMTMWSFVPLADTSSLTLLVLTRAMQGIACAAMTSSCIPLYTRCYPDKKKYNTRLAIYTAFAPIGFYAGIATASSLADDQWWWFFLAAGLASLVVLTLGYLCIPTTITDPDEDEQLLDWKMLDWPGSISSSLGIVMLVYALSASSENGATWTSPNVLGTLCAGIFCLGVFCFLQASVVEHPLLPLSFFRPSGTIVLTIASLFMYSSFEVWLFESEPWLSARFGVPSSKICLWFLPMVVGGIILSCTAGKVIDRCPIFVLFAISGFANVGAPILLRFAPIAQGFWPGPFFSMICATAGIDLLYTANVLFLSGIQPEQNHGLVGAYCSLTVQLATSFSLAFAQMIQTAGLPPDSGAAMNSQDAKKLTVDHIGKAFYYAAASASVGLVLVLAFALARRINTLLHAKSERDPESIPVMEFVVVQGRGTMADTGKVVIRSPNGIIEVDG